MDMLSPVSAALGVDVPEHHWDVAHSDAQRNHKEMKETHGAGI
jgi:hypothetical protein